MRADHPTPVVACRDAVAEEIPRTAATLMEIATDAGWTVRATYAEGNTLAAHGEPGRVVGSLAVRLYRRSQRVVGIWHDGKFSCGLVRDGTSQATTRIGSRELRELVAAAA